VPYRRWVVGESCAQGHGCEGASKKYTETCRKSMTRKSDATSLNTTIFFYVLTFSSQSVLPMRYRLAAARTYEGPCTRGAWLNTKAASLGCKQVSSQAYVYA
jgi:hypothetical protein